MINKFLTIDKFLMIDDEHAAKEWRAMDRATLLYRIKYKVRLTREVTWTYKTRDRQSSHWEALAILE